MVWKDLDSTRENGLKSGLVCGDSSARALHLNDNSENAILGTPSNTTAVYVLSTALYADRCCFHFILFIICVKVVSSEQMLTFQVVLRRYSIVWGVVERCSRQLMWLWWLPLASDFVIGFVCQSTSDVCSISSANKRYKLYFNMSYMDFGSMAHASHTKCSSSNRWTFGRNDIGLGRVK